MKLSFEDGLRCAVSHSYVYCGDESERRLLLFDLTDRRLIGADAGEHVDLTFVLKEIACIWVACVGEIPQERLYA